MNGPFDRSSNWQTCSTWVLKPKTEDMNPIRFKTQVLSNNWLSRNGQALAKLFFEEEQHIHSKSLHPQPPWLFAGEVLVLLAAGFANPSTPCAEKKLVGLI